MSGTDCHMAGLGVMTDTKVIPLCHSDRGSWLTIAARVEIRRDGIYRGTRAF